MELKDVITRDQVVDRMAASDKLELLKLIAARAAKITGVEAASVLGALRAREELGSTGIGQGIAVPHAEISGLQRFFGMFVRLEKPIDFAAVDGRPVDLAFVLLIPRGAAGSHLGLLAALSRKVRDPAIARNLRTASDRNVLYDVLTGPSPKGAT